MKIIKIDDVNYLLEHLRNELRTIFAEHLVGIYVYGSYVVGGFNPDTSDIDLPVVVDEEIQPKRFADLDDMHNRLIKDHPSWNDRLEIAYVSREALKFFKTKPYQIAVISPGEPFNIKVAEPDWLMNWYLIQENSLLLWGSDFYTIIDPISQTEFLNTVKNHGLKWREWVTDTKNSLGFQFYAVLTICRVIYTLKNSEQVSKSKAGQWAKGEYPQWRSLIDSALVWQTTPQNATVGGELLYPEVEKFVYEMTKMLE